MQSVETVRCNVDPCPEGASAEAAAAAADAEELDVIEGAAVDPYPDCLYVRRGVYHSQRRNRQSMGSVRSPSESSMLLPSALPPTSLSWRRCRSFFRAV